MHKFSLHIIKLIVLFALISTASCKELIDEPRRETIIVSDPVIERAGKEKLLNVSVLLGRWTVDLDELENEIKRNIPDKKRAQEVIDDLHRRYKSFGMEFFEDKRYALYINDEQVEGLWDLSSDKLSYNIQMSEDYYELHEVISLTDDTLIELPVAEMRKAGVPAKQLVYRRVEE